MFEGIANLIAIVKPVGDWCNLKCGYCFHRLQDRTTRRVMSLDLLEKFLREYFALPFKIFVFSWHGGEPLLAGLPFFEQAVRLQKRFLPEGGRIRNGVQTNGTLIDEEWVQFFKENGFGVGVSLDGDRESHNRFRCDCRGQGSFDKTIRGMNILRDSGIRPGIIHTLTRDNLSQAIQNFRFFLEMGLKSFGTNPYLDLSDGAMSRQSVSGEEFTDFLKTCVEFWLKQDDPHLQFREIDNFIAGLLGKQAVSPCNFNGYCHLTFTVGCNGEVYPCDRFYGREEFLLGNLEQQSLREILYGPVHSEWIRRIHTLPSECESCRWRTACRNGCSYLRVGGIEGKYYYCQTRKEIFALLEEKLKKYRKEVGL